MDAHNFVSGKYMQMITVLKPIAFDVIYCISQLFDYITLHSSSMEKTS
jgi:hypothetical protein